LVVKTRRLPRVFLVGNGTPGDVWIQIAERFHSLPEYQDPDQAPWKGLENWIVDFGDTSSGKK